MPKLTGILNISLVVTMFDVSLILFSSDGTRKGFKTRQKDETESIWMTRSKLCCN